MGEQETERRKKNGRKKERRRGNERRKVRDKWKGIERSRESLYFY